MKTGEFKVFGKTYGYIEYQLGAKKSLPINLTNHKIIMNEIDIIKNYLEIAIPSSDPDSFHGVMSNVRALMLARENVTKEDVEEMMVELGLNSWIRFVIHGLENGSDKPPFVFSTLRDANLKRSVEWCGEEPTESDLLFCSNELAGEVGELCNVVKKIERANNGMHGGITTQEAVEKIKDEVADVVICADRLASCVNIHLGCAVIDKFNKTSEKHGFETKL